MTPDEALVNLHLDAIRHVVLDRCAEFPRAQRPYIYCFDELPRGTIDAHTRRAVTMAALLGQDAEVEIEQMIWV
eukprot:3818647-Heterocapsa_arctica.AAC.1